MDEDDLYPGEWALGAADRQSDLLGRMWIASGDVVICPDFMLQFTGRATPDRSTTFR